MYTVKRWSIQLQQNNHPEYAIELIADNVSDAIKLAESLYGQDCLSTQPKEIIRDQGTT